MCVCVCVCVCVHTHTHTHTHTHQFVDKRPRKSAPDGSDGDMSDFQDSKRARGTGPKWEPLNVSDGGSLLTLIGSLLTLIGSLLTLIGSLLTLIRSL